MLLYENTETQEIELFFAKKSVLRFRIPTCSQRSAELLRVLKKVNLERTVVRPLHGGILCASAL